MTHKKQDSDEYVKKSTMVMVAAFTLIIGFLGGVAMTVYQSVPGMPSKTFQEQANAGDMDRMIKALVEETAKNPGNHEAWAQLGHSYFDSDQYEKAIGAYNKSLEISPDSADVWTDLGVMYRRNGQPKEAISSFDKAIEKNPAHETSRFNKGIVLLHDLDDQKSAVAAWQGLVKVNPLAMAPNGQTVEELIKHYTDHGE